MRHDFGDVSYFYADFQKGVGYMTRIHNREPPRKQIAGNMITGNFPKLFTETRKFFYNKN